MLISRAALAISLLPLIALFGQGCSKSSQPLAKKIAKPTTPDITSRVDEWVWDAGLFARDKSVSELRKIAPVLRETTEIRTSRGQEGEKQTSSILSLYYDGLTISGMSDGNKFTLDSIEISNPKWPVPNGLSVGAKANLVPPVFGLPTRELKAPDELFSGLGCSVKFTTHTGRISKVSFYYFYD